MVITTTKSDYKVRSSTRNVDMANRHVLISEANVHFAMANHKYANGFRIAARSDSQNSQNIHRVKNLASVIADARSAGDNSKQLAQSLKLALEAQVLAIKMRERREKRRRVQTESASHLSMMEDMVEQAMLGGFE